MSDLDGAFCPLEPVGRIGIGESAGGNTQEDQLAGIVLFHIQTGFQLSGLAAFPVSYKQPVTYPIEKQDR